MRFGEYVVAAVLVLAALAVLAFVVPRWMRTLGEAFAVLRQRPAEGMTVVGSARSTPLAGFPRTTEPVEVSARTSDVVEEERTDLVITGVPMEPAEPPTSRVGMRIRITDDVNTDPNEPSQVRTLQVDGGPLVRLELDDDRT